jgi:hypothetical protein
MNASTNLPGESRRANFLLDAVHETGGRESTRHRDRVADGL